MDDSAVLDEHALISGWRSPTHPLQDETFAGEAGLFGAICANPANRFVPRPHALSVLGLNFDRHESNRMFVGWAEDLPANIVS